MSPTTDLANTDLVLLAMALAGAGDDFADIEDIALEAFALSPQRFGWRTKEFPSDKIVVQAIADLEAKHNKDSLTLRGFKDRADKVATRRLTTDGRKSALRVGAKVAGRDFPDLPTMVAHFHRPESGAPEPTPADRRLVQAELGELRRHRVFQEWADTGDVREVERWQLLDALSCLPDAPAWAVRDQTEKLIALAERWQDTEVINFLDALSGAIGAGGADQ
jgi:hypothetical protein